MRIKKLVLKNFMSFKSESFDDLDRSGLTLIEGENVDEGGSNGSGKSSLWDGISFALFGQTVRGLKGDDVIRWQQKNCEVELYFDFKDTEWKVVRQRKPDRLYVELDGKITELGTQAMTQQWINDKLEIDFDLFRATVVFAQEETFNFVNATNKEQKEILSKIMRINYDQYQGKVKAKLKDLKEESEDIDRKLLVLQSHIVEDENELYREEIEEWDEKRASRIKRKVEEIETLKDKLRAEIPDLKESENQLKENEAKQEKISAKIDRMRTNASDLKAEIKQAKIYLDKTEDLMKAPECPTCGGKIDGFVLAENLKEADKNMEINQQQLNDLQVDLEKYEEAIMKIKKINHELRNTIMTTRVQLQNRSLLEEAQASLKKEIKLIREELNPFLNKKQEAIKKQEEIKLKVEELDKKKKLIDDNIPYLDFWVNAFGDSGIKSFVFDLVCSTLTTRTNYYLNLLTNGRVVVTFDTQKETKSGDVREKFDCTVLVDGKSVKYASYSGGEKRRISLAVDLALSDLMSDYYVQKFNIIVLDEQSNFLDNEGRAAYLKLLKEIAKSRHVFVVDHDSEFKALFSDTITIQKKDGISTVLQ